MNNDPHHRTLRTVIEIVVFVAVVTAIWLAIPLPA